MEPTLRPATGGGTWRPALRPLDSGRAGRSLAGSARWLAWAARLGSRYGAADPAWDHLSAVLRSAAPVSAPGPGHTVIAHPPGPVVTWPISLTLHLAIPAARAQVAGL